MILFAYNFPHKKTQDFIFHCMALGHKIDLILAADPVELNIPKSAIRSKIRSLGLLHPKDIANSFNIEYKVVEHNSAEVEQLLDSIKPKLGLISGARILKKNIINKFELGIINFHPGLIPESRGLDALFWSIHHGIALGVTSHLIDARVDAGKLIQINKIPIHSDDTLLDLSQKLYEIQLDMIDSSIRKALNGETYEINFENTGYNRKMPRELELEVESKLADYKLKFIR